MASGDRSTRGPFRVPRFHARKVPRVLIGCAIGLLAAIFPAPALAIDEFPVPSAASQPAGIALGPDGNIWFTEEAPAVNQIGRLNPITGVVTGEFPVPSKPPNNSTSFGPSEITAGPDGRMWFTGFTTNKIGAITTSGLITITEYDAPLLSNPDGIVWGPDNGIWYTESNRSRIARLDPFNPTAAPKEFQLPTGSGPGDIALGPDGRLWFTEGAPANKVGAIPLTATSGSDISEFDLPAGGDPSGITASAGALWFTEFAGNKIGRITTAGVVTNEFGPTGAGPSAVATGPDGALWFTESDANKIGRITTGGSIIEFPVPTGASQPNEIAAGPGGLWFTEASGNKIARIAAAAPSVVIAPPAPPPPPPATQQSAKKCKVPKLKGLTRKKARKKLVKARCKFKFRGKGKVRSTSPKAGTRTSKTVQVKLKKAKKAKRKR
jgi:virginiamycin B lyase